MDINEIEKKIASHEFDRDKILAALVKNTAFNRALLETIFEMQVNILSLMMPDKPFEEIGAEAADILASKQIDALAKLLSQLYTD